MSKAMVVGLTGPIGSGKSVVAAVFCDNSYKLIDADKLAKKVVEKGSKTLVDLADAFGEDIIEKDGTLNRKLLSQRAFESSKNTLLLNSITHPAIIELVKKQIEDYTAQGYLKIIYDAPLLFESKSDALCDKIVTVIAKREHRIQRVKKRDNMSDEQIKKRMSAQHDDSFYTDRSDYVIFNDGSLENLLFDAHRVITALDEVKDGTL